MNNDGKQAEDTRLNDIEVTVRVNTAEEADTVRAVVASFNGEPTEYFCTSLKTWLPWGTVLCGQYRPKACPWWKLPDQLPGFRALRSNEVWHRMDMWNANMLPAGWRPLLLDEMEEPGDEQADDSMCNTWTVLTVGQCIPGRPYIRHVRTYRPLPEPDPLAHIKEAHKAGKTVQYSDQNTDPATGDFMDEWSSWMDWPDTSMNLNRICDGGGTRRWRIKPEPKMVPLGPEDVPPGSAIRGAKWSPANWAQVRRVESCWVHLDDAVIEFARLQSEGWLIHRPGNPVWLKCEKEAE